jgi:lipoate-protein ligase A
MKNFVLDELLLLSHVEKRARRLTFDPKTTVVLGENDTG